MKKVLVTALVIAGLAFSGCSKKVEEAPAETTTAVEANTTEANTSAPAEANTTEANTSAPAEANTTEANASH